MPTEVLTLAFDDATAPLRQAATEEVVIHRFGGTGPSPRVSRITVEYEDSRVPVVPTEKPAPGVVPNIDPYRGYEPVLPKPGGAVDELVDRITNPVPRDC